MNLILQTIFTDSQPQCVLEIFYLLTKDVRDMQGGTVDTFKTSLDSWLSQVPDQPTVVGRQRAAATNSLIDQVVMNH